MRTRLYAVQQNSGYTRLQYMGLPMQLMMIINCWLFNVWISIAILWIERKFIEFTIAQSPVHWVAYLRNFRGWDSKKSSRCNSVSLIIKYESVWLLWNLPANCQPKWNMCTMLFLHPPQIRQKGKVPSHFHVVCLPYSWLDFMVFSR